MAELGQELEQQSAFVCIVVAHAASILLNLQSCRLLRISCKTNVNIWLMERAWNTTCLQSLDALPELRQAFPENNRKKGFVQMTEKG
jgi:hypothetical protein